MKNILVFNVNWVGDVIFSTPIFKALKKAYPQATVSCIAVPRVQDILKSCPYVDEIIIYDEKGCHYSAWGKLKIIWQLRKKKFDIVFLLHRSWTRAFLVCLAWIKRRVGYDTKKRGWLLTHRVEPLEDDVPHRSDFYIHVIEDYGVKVDDRTCELAVDPKDMKKVRKILWDKNISPEERFVVINPGGNWDLKRWPKENFTKLVKRIVDELHVKVVISGAPKDIKLADNITSSSGVNCINLAGKTNLKQLVALMECAHTVVSSDSGPMHIANCVGTNTIGIFGPTRPEITGPRGKGKTIILQEDIKCNQYACYNLNCLDNICMKTVTVDAVFDAVSKFLNRDHA
jgi:lipopolysaccharide heptosyltransferase II